MPGSFPSRANAALFSSHSQEPPENYLIAHVDGGSRGNPGPAGYGVVITDENDKRVCTARLTCLLRDANPNGAGANG